MPKQWANTHLCTSKVTPRGAFWKKNFARKRGKPPPPFFEVANFRQNGMTSHFAETPPQGFPLSPLDYAPMGDVWASMVSKAYPGVHTPAGLLHSLA